MASGYARFRPSYLLEQYAFRRLLNTLQNSGELGSRAFKPGVERWLRPRRCRYNTVALAEEGLLEGIVALPGLYCLDVKGVYGAWASGAPLAHRLPPLLIRQIEDPESSMSSSNFPKP